MLLQVAHPSAIVLERLAGNWGLGFLGLRGPWTPAHGPPFTTDESAGDTLGEPVSQGKGTAYPAYPEVIPRTALPPPRVLAECSPPARQRVGAVSAVFGGCCPCS